MPRNVKISAVAIGVAACVFGTATTFAQEHLHGCAARSTNGRQRSDNPDPER